MSINSHIVGNDNKHVDSIKKDGYRGLYVISSDLKTYRNRSSFFINPDYGANMNRDFSTIVTSADVHNGNDEIYWTATIISGQPSDFNFSSTLQAHTGTQSINCVPSEAGDSFQLEDETQTYVDGVFDRFIGWVYVEGSWINRESSVYVYLYNTILDLQVSENQINLDDYVNGADIGTWQRFSIPMTAFGNLSDDFNAIRIVIGSIGPTPDFYLDDLRLDDLGESTNEFSIQPPLGNWWHVDGLGIIIASNYNASLVDSSIPNIPYNGLLGVPLVNGIQYQRKEEGNVEFSLTMNHLIDILNQYDASISSSGYDGVYTWIKIDMNFRTPFILKAEFEDFISFTLSDDLSGLEVLRIVASIQEEKRNVNNLSYDLSE